MRNASIHIFQLLILPILIQSTLLIPVMIYPDKKICLILRILAPFVSICIGIIALSKVKLRFNRLGVMGLSVVYGICLYAVLTVYSMMLGLLIWGPPQFPGNEKLGMPEKKAGGVIKVRSVHGSRISEISNKQITTQMFN